MRVKQNRTSRFLGGKVLFQSEVVGLLNHHYPINGSYIVAALQSRIKDIEAEMAEIEKQLEPCTSQRKHPKR